MPHIFDSVSDDEIRTTARVVKALHGDAKIQFSQIDRLDPPKQLALEYLAAERQGSALPEVPRRTYCYYYRNQTVPLRTAVVDVAVGAVLSDEAAPKGVVGPMCPEGMQAAESAVLAHPVVQQEIALLGLDKLHYDHPRLGRLRYKVTCDTWMYGRDTPGAGPPLVQAYMYVQLDHPDANHYSMPLRFSPVFEYLTHKFVRIDYLPTGADAATLQKTLPFKQVKSLEYHPNLLDDATPRAGLKPLQISQPSGVSFAVEGSRVTWQGWDFRVATNVREGFALYDVHFKGRSLFYRISLNEMTVPYGDGRPPFHRKQAFDLGDCGFGATAGSLGLGCHCVGVVKYLDTRRTDLDGNPVLVPSSVCMHEQDYGILHLHRNFRNNSEVVTRRREFVVQCVATVANYEYILNYVFDQAGAITVQVRATGILSTVPVDDDVNTDFSTIVGPGVTAPFHQHLLSFRFDTRLDGDENTVVYDDYVADAPGGDMNRYNVAFRQKRTVLDRSGYIEQSPFTNRAFKVINEKSINPVTRRPVAYKFDMPARQMLIALPDSFNARRAKYSTQQFWVCRHADDRRYAAGEFTNQSERDSGLSVWADGSESVRNTDIVVWPTLALTHAPVTEQFPVMASDFMQFLVTPASFFTENPALDIPMANNAFHGSAYYEDNHAAAGQDAAACCKGNL
ncbi:AGL073Wp [Eremothecium gossypii ATCC 10895]|uniref:Amine oxidase n=1 Tax=Eremothecium gossypii (strain ATCC 10895 / CBS 109.51 / FGSC 9923 / NRRL Y-1056) TaxID=284811 RepID=Q750M9_EREGS|nr:AGL073Wp [Eremothecium gossypii ATCC 10895]AAS54417.2 AGL073Wp [Eremothecium gossypii ATCC 10895]AEY98745.1 FAGL073Wp [Eremothecium gossypii FDAG1]